MKAALWTPSPYAAWVEVLRTALGSEPELLLVGAEPGVPPACDVDLYHVANLPAHGFVYRALVRRPGIVLLAEWDIHDLVHAETAGRGDGAGYRREARRAHGDTGEFVARQVLAGLGGALPALLPMNLRVLESSLALVALTEPLRARAAAALPGRPVVHLALTRLDPTTRGADPAGLASALGALIRAVVPGAGAARAAFAAQRAAEGTPREHALAELRWTARELALAAPPEDAERLVAALFGEGP